jgi:hypothetical protein
VGMDILTEFLRILFEPIDWGTVLFIISAGEFAKKIFKSLGIDFLNSFWQVTIVVTPFALLWANYNDLDMRKFFISYFFAFWLYQAIAKRILLFFGLKKNN